MNVDNMEPVLAGPVRDLVQDLERNIDGGRFTEADIGSDLGGRFVLRTLVPDYELAVRARERRWSMRNRIAAPMFEVRVEIDRVIDISVIDESETYYHETVTVGFESVADLLVFESTPPLRIELELAGEARVRILRGTVPAETLHYTSIGPVESS